MGEQICNGIIDYRGDPFNVDFDGYYCTVCGLTGADDSKLYGNAGKNLPHKKGVGGYERDVIDAAIAMVEYEMKAAELLSKTPSLPNDLGFSRDADTNSEEWKRYCDYVNANSHLCIDFRHATRRLIEITHPAQPAPEPEPHRQ